MVKLESLRFFSIEIVKYERYTRVVEHKRMMQTTDSDLYSISYIQRFSLAMNVAVNRLENSCHSSHHWLDQKYREVTTHQVGPMAVTLIQFQIVRIV